MKLGYLLLYGDEVAAAVEFYERAFDRAIQAGASLVLRPTQKPGGQWVSYVRDRNGFLVEICSPMG